jgi:hypothetical protein
MPLKKNFKKIFKLDVLKTIEMNQGSFAIIVTISFKNVFIESSLLLFLVKNEI